MWHDPILRDMTHPYVAWLIHMWHDSSICDMAHTGGRSTVRSCCYWCTLRRKIHASLWCVTWLIHTWHDSFICDMTHSYMRNDGTVTADSPCGENAWPLSGVWHDSFICHMTHSYVTRLIHMWHDSFAWCVTWWNCSCRRALRLQSLRLAGSLKYRSLLQNIVCFIGLFCKRDLSLGASCHFSLSFVFALFFSCVSLLCLLSTRKASWILRVSNPATRKDLADRTWGGSGTNPKCRVCSR